MSRVAATLPTSNAVMGSHAEAGDQAQGEQRSADRTKIVHRPLKAVSPAIRLGGNEAASRALRAGTRKPRANYAPARRAQACHTLSPQEQAQLDSARERLAAAGRHDDD
jgi:hypothetical protein